MDWDRRSIILWLDKDAGYPTADEFEHDPRAIAWDYAIEALSSIYARQDEPIPPQSRPWMLWNDGTIFTPGQIGAVRAAYEFEVEARGGAFGRKGLEAVRAFV